MTVLRPEATGPNHPGNLVATNSTDQDRALEEDPEAEAHQEAMDHRAEATAVIKTHRVVPKVVMKATDLVIWGNHVGMRARSAVKKGRHVVALALHVGMMGHRGATKTRHVASREDQERIANLVTKAIGAMMASGDQQGRISEVKNPKARVL